LQVEVFLQRISFLESKIAPCEQEAAEALALKEELEEKRQECADLDEALRELELQVERASLPRAVQMCVCARVHAWARTRARRRVCVRACRR
jgi:predicted RecB family endonuclease